MISVSLIVVAALLTWGLIKYTSHKAWTLFIGAVLGVILAPTFIGDIVTMVANMVPELLQTFFEAVQKIVTKRA